MSRQNIVAGIDVGNANVKTVIAEIDRENLRPRILGVGSSESTGLRKGMVVDMEEAIGNVRQSVAKAESMAGVKVKRAYVSINGLHIKNQVSKGVVAVSRADNEISSNDIERVIEAASVVSLPANRQKIHVLPKNFVVDGHEHVRDPLGMKGVRIEADVLIIDGLSPYIHNLAKCINENDIEIAEFVFSPLAAAKAVLDKGQREHGVLCLDFGGGVSNLALFSEGDLIHASVLPIGSRHITNDLAVALRSSMDIAEQAKIQFGSLNEARAVNKNDRLGSKNIRKDEIDLSELMGEENFIIPRKQISKVIEARVHELFDMVGNEIKKINYTKIIPAGIILCGGGSNLAGIASFARDKINLPVRLSNYSSFDGMVDQVNDLSFAVAAGLVLWGIEKEGSDLGFKGSNVLNFKNNNLIKKTGDWLKNFLP